MFVILTWVAQCEMYFLLRAMVKTLDYAAPKFLHRQVIMKWKLSSYSSFFIPDAGIIILSNREVGGFPGGSVVKNPPATQETWVQFLGQEAPPEKGMATHSSILVWEIQGQRSLAGYGPWGRKSRTRLSHSTAVATGKSGLERLRTLQLGKIRKTNTVC